jgi:N-acetyl-D-muramate 6-phosphate phosphatase
MNIKKLGKIDAVLFDLDGTLIDTAPDMVAVLSQMQRAYDVDLLPYESARANVSNGAIGLLKLAFPESVEPDFGSLHREYLERYEAALCIESSMFPDMPELLDALDAGQVPYGIVTNKPQHLTDPLLATLGLSGRLSCCVSGDTLAQRKPDPAPLLYACDQAGVPPHRAVYVGDAARDMEAGQAAGMSTIAAGYGYIVPGDDPATWNAGAIAADTKELAKMLLKAVNLEA